jgi:hypothetical protein
MLRHMARRPASGAVDPANARHCALCGAVLRFSHRGYAGRGATVAVFRCTACGATSTAPLPADAAEARRPRTRKPPVDEGPPANPVLDPEIARRLLEG